jgi:cytochrome d ubiquinol oxidase subunit I
MGTSLGFHIVFAALGVGLPVLLMAAEGIGLRRHDQVWVDLARRWAKAFGILFAVGAVSGTVLSFELGLLWPGFMRYAGQIIGMPFSLEGFAFFLEAIFLGLYLYGWERLSPLAHWLCSIPISISGAASAWFVVTANAWMNSPAGFRLDHGVVTDVDPLAAMLNRGTPIETVHVMLSCYLATGFAVAAVYAAGILRGRRGALHRRGLALGLAMGAVAAPLMIVTGDINARWVADNQPAKLAAMEGQFQTEAGAPLRIGGFPDPGSHTTPLAIEIPAGLSFLAYGSTTAVVRGLDSFPAGSTPDPRPVHVGFQVMVGIGFFLLGVAALFLVLLWRRHRVPTDRPLLWALVASGFLGFTAIEAGWMVTEIGRQPWIVYGVLRTRDAITPAPGLVLSFVLSTALYVGLGLILVVLLLRLAAGTRRSEREAASDGIGETLPPPRRRPARGRQ